MAALNTVKREENGIISDVALAQVKSAIRPLTRRSGFLPCAVLFFLAPLVGEVLAGSTPLDILGSPASFLTLFLLEALLYGSGALLIREIARRTGRGWPAILGLGLAYGVLEEGLITQSFFNPDFLGLHLLGLGSLLGLGWVWITDLVPLHAVWSIGVPIALAELLFRGRGTDAWLGRLGLTLASALFAVGVLSMWLATYASERNFVAPWPKLLGALAVVVVITQLALGLTRRSAGAGSAAVALAPSACLVGVASFTAASLFMGVHQLYSAFPNLPGPVHVARDRGEERIRPPHRQEPGLGPDPPPAPGRGCISNGRVARLLPDLPRRPPQPCRPGRGGWAGGRPRGRAGLSDVPKPPIPPS